MEKIKNIFILVLSIAFLAIGVVAVIYKDKYESTQEKYKKEIVNNKALEQELYGEKNKVISYEYNIKELKNSKDSINKDLLRYKKEFGIKDKNLLALQKIKDSIGRGDTLKLKDTIFVKGFKLDTVIQDRWSRLVLNLEYPNKVIVDRSFNTDKNIIVSLKKETIDTPKKFFLLRWFQKKHYITIVDVEEKNPYSTIKFNRYIKIIK